VGFSKIPNVKGFSRHANSRKVKNPLSKGRVPTNSSVLIPTGDVPEVCRANCVDIMLPKVLSHRWVMEVPKQ
jgi:hypothetical protein